MQKHFNDPYAKPPLPPSTPPLAVHDSPYPQTHNSMEESPSSPFRYGSPRLSEEPDRKQNSGGGTAVMVEKYYSPLQSPLPLTPPKDAPTPDNFSSNPNSHVINFNRAMREGTTSSAMVLGGEVGGNREKKKVTFGRRSWKDEEEVEEEEEKRSGGAVEQIVSRSGKKVVLARFALGLRVCEFVLTLISFSVMAADKTQGWSGDSFDRYEAYRFCLSINVIAFVYAVFQIYDLSSSSVSGKHVISHHLRYHFIFILDQILAYLLLSASSAAASKIDDWQSNWGKDEFTEKASASVSMSFIAFFCFAFSSLLSGYNLCNQDLS